jgi:hypothetical protein
MDEETKGMAGEPTPTKQAWEEARHLSEAVRDRAFKTGDERRQQLASEAGRIAERLEELAARDGGEPLVYAQRAADFVRRLENTLQAHSTEELLHLAEDRIRRRPGLFLAGCFAVGFGAARLLRK